MKTTVSFAEIQAARAKGKTIPVLIDEATGALVVKLDTIGLTDSQLRASPIAVSVGGVATEATLAMLKSDFSAAGNITTQNSVPAIAARGAQANAWSAAAVLAGGVSTSLDTSGSGFVSAFGNAGAATTITLQVSADNTNFYDTAITQVLAGAGNFHLSLNTGARYVRLKSSAAATITASIQAKG